MSPGRLRRHALVSVLLLLLLVPAVLAGPGPTEGRHQELNNRRAALGAHVDEGTFVLFGPSTPDVRAAQTEPNFQYLSGLTEPGSALVVTVGRPASTDAARKTLLVALKIERNVATLRSLLRRSGSPRTWSELSPLLRDADRTVRRAREQVRQDRGPASIETRLYLLPRSKRRERWTGPTLFPGPDAAEETGIVDIRPVGQILTDLQKLPPGSQLFLLDAEGSPPQALVSLLEQRTDLKVRSAHPIIGNLRAVKSQAEVALIRRACDLTATGLLRVMRTCRPGMVEYELQAALEFECRRGGARRQAFDSIVASGPNGTILHYRTNRRTTLDGDLVLMDVGAEYRGYAADITRTFPVSGRFSEEQARIYDVVLKSQQAAIAAVRPGATLADINAAARVVIKEAGLLRGWMHAVSHHVGLDVHDPGSAGPLREGMVITVEPGLYFPDTGIGIRIEDTVVVTAGGCLVLSERVAKDRLLIEAIMVRGRLTEERER